MLGVSEAPAQHRDSPPVGPAAAGHPTLAGDDQPKNTYRGSQIDPVAAERTALLTEFKARGRAVGIGISDEMVAKAANPGKWNDRTMVTRWKRNDPRFKQPHDKKIRAVLARDPRSVWSSKH